MIPNTNDWYLAGIKSRDNEVTKAIVAEFLPMVVSFVRSHGGRKEDAQEVFTDALIALWRKIEVGELVLTCAFSTLLFEICKRQWLNKFRRKKFDAWVTIDDPLVYNLILEVGEHFEKTERFRLLCEVFRLLPETCRKILDLSWHTDKSLEQIAREVGVTYGYVRKRKSDCQDRLEELIRNDARYDELKAF